MQAYKFRSAGAIAVLCAALLVPLCTSCFQAHRKPVVLWTDQAEFVSYAELFNAAQDSAKVIVVYKKNPAESLPPAKDEKIPDIVAGPWLKNEQVRKNFMPVDYLFGETEINPASFYPQLLETGRIKRQQYLLPVSFNLPLVIFNTKMRGYFDNSRLISLEQMQDAGAAYNKKNKSGIYTSMGFAPSWNPRFLYLTAKLYGADFCDTRDGISWNQQNIDAAVMFLREWTRNANTSTAAEEDFKFKYLYTPQYKQIQDQHNLFAFMPSNEYFSIASEKRTDIDYFWIHKNGIIPVEDKIIYIGIYRHSNNVAAAEQFLIWLMKENSQKAILERNAAMKLNVTTFGISDGFSAIKKVTEQIFPSFYPVLFRNLPITDKLALQGILPARWEDITERVVIPYLTDAADTEKEQPEFSMEKRISEWNKQYF